MNKAITKYDLLRSRTRQFKSLLDKTIGVCSEHIERYKMGISFSGGKDSVVMINIMQNIDPELRAGFYDSGLEYDETYDIIKHYNCDTIIPEYSMIEMLHHTGWGGCEKTMEGNVEFDYTGFLVYEPAKRFCDYYGFDTIAIGLRANESKGRLMNFKFRGFHYPVIDEPDRFLPMSLWKEDDIWAYIAMSECVYNPIYDLMTEYGIPRNEQRVSTLIGAKGTNLGRMTRLRMIKPKLFNRLATEFPLLLRQT